MRLDKFLKVSRLIKRRSVAKEVADLNRSDINGKVAKPASQVKVGDLITLRLGMKSITAKVTSLTYNKDLLMYELIEEKKLNSFDA